MKTLKKLNLKLQILLLDFELENLRKVYWNVVPGRKLELFNRDFRRCFIQIKWLERKLNKLEPNEALKAIQKAYESISAAYEASAPGDEKARLLEALRDLVQYLRCEDYNGVRILAHEVLDASEALHSQKGK
jgi:hypothetical protein